MTLTDEEKIMVVFLNRWVLFIINAMTVSHLVDGMTLISFHASNFNVEIQLNSIFNIILKEQYQIIHNLHIKCVYAL